jgi:CBS domain-containing protein
VGYFSEKGFKNGIKHEAHVPKGLTVGEMARSDLFTVTPDTPVVGAIHDLIRSGARHAVLLREAGDGDGSDGDASTRDRVVRRDSVPTDRIAAVVSIRDMLGHAIGVHFKALERAQAAMEQARMAKETGTDPSEAAVAAIAEWETLSQVEAKLDTSAYGSVIKDAEDVLETLSRLGKRTAYINCLDDAKIDTAAAVNMLGQEEVAALLVVSPESQIRGIFTMRDFIWKIAAPGASDAPRDAVKTKVTDVMTTDVRVGRINWPVEKCARVMLRHSIRHLPLASKGDGDFMGLVSLADVTRFTVKARFQPAPEDEAKDNELRKQAVEYFEDLASYGRA